MNDTLGDGEYSESPQSLDNNNTRSRRAVSPTSALVSPMFNANENHHNSAEPYSRVLVSMNDLYELLKEQETVERKILDIETEFYFREIHDASAADESTTLDLIILYGNLEELKTKTTRIKNELVNTKAKDVLRSRKGTKKKSRLDCIVDFIVSVEQRLEFISIDKQNLREKIRRMRETKLASRTQLNNDIGRDSSNPTNSKSLSNVGKKRACSSPIVSQVEKSKKQKRALDSTDLNGNASTSGASSLPTPSVVATNSVNRLAAIASTPRLRPRRTNDKVEKIVENSTSLLNSSEILVEKNNDVGTARSKTTIDPQRQLVVLLSRINVDEYFRRTKPVPGLAGLENEGNNWSSLNSVVQCLSNTPKIAQYFTGVAWLRHLQALKGIPPTAMGYQVSVAFASVIRSIWSGEHRTVSPTKLRDAISLKEEYSNTNGYDPQRFLTFLLDMLHRNFRKKDGSEFIGPLSRDELEWQKCMGGRRSIISDLFFGQTRTSHICDKCKYESIKYKVMSSINIPLHLADCRNKRSCRLDYLLQQSLRRRCVRGWTCPNCGNPEGMRKLDFTKLGPIAIIQVDRYARLHNRRRKIVKTIEYKDYHVQSIIKIPRLVVQDPESDYRNDVTVDQMYKLYAICCYKGPLIHGNFYAVCESSTDSESYVYDNEKVTTENPRTNHDTDSYIFFYKLSNLDPAYSDSILGQENAGASP